MNRPDLLDGEGMKKAAVRLKPENARRLHDVVKDWVRSQDEKELLEVGRKFAFPLSPVMDDLQICHDPWRRERGSVVLYDDEMYKKLVLSGPMAMLSKTPSENQMADPTSRVP